MIDPHMSAAIAQVVFYVPIVPIVMFLVISNWNKRPRTAITPLMVFSWMRLAGGVVVIIQQSSNANKGNLGLIIAAIILLNVGVVPLIVCAVGVMRLVVKLSFAHDGKWGLIARGIRFTFIAAIILLAASGAVISTDASVARDLGKVGYIVFALVVVVVTGLLLVLRRKGEAVTEKSIVFINGALLAMPFLMIRTVYGLLYEFTSETYNSTWNPLFGSVVAFALMALLTEYIAVLIFIYLGFVRRRMPA